MTIQSRYFDSFPLFILIPFYCLQTKKTYRREAASLTLPLFILFCPRFTGKVDAICCRLFARGQKNSQWGKDVGYMRLGTHSETGDRTLPFPGALFSRGERLETKAQASSGGRSISHTSDGDNPERAGVVLERRSVLLKIHPVSVRLASRLRRRHPRHPMLSTVPAFFHFFLSRVIIPRSRWRVSRTLFFFSLC